MEALNNNYTLYNSPLEIGVRTLVLLNQFYPTELDLIQLIWFNHIVVHTSDYDGPSSLHPNLEDRVGELSVLRQTVNEGLTLMRRYDLIMQHNKNDGIFYSSTDSGFSFIELMKAEYIYELKKRASWIVKDFYILGRKSIERIMGSKIRSWRVE